MLPRAGFRVANPSPILFSHLRIGPLLAAAPSLQTRTYTSSGSKPPKSSPKSSPRPLPSSQRSSIPPPPQPFSPSTGSTRLSSPGTSPPQEKTWRPKNGINFGSPAAAATTDAAASRSAVEKAQVGSGAKEAEAQVPDDAAAAQEQIANAQAEQQEQPAEESISKTSSLPDLRQGIPSTFVFEFGAKKPGVGGVTSSEQAAEERQEQLETTPLEENEQRREREYDRSAYETSFDRRRARMANYMYASIILGALSGCLYLTRPFSSLDDAPQGLAADDASGWLPRKMYHRVRARFGNQMGYYTEPSFPKLLPDVPESKRPPFTLVLSLEDLMIHTSWDTTHGYRTAKRPGIDYFIRYLSQYYELVLFTSAPRSMADPVVAKLDPYHFIMWPLGREATKYEGGEYVKDLSYLNRPLKKTLIIDTHAPHVKNQPENAIIIPKWNGDAKDPHTKDLVALIPFLEYVATMGTDDVRPVLKSFEGKSIPEEFARRENEARKKFHEQLEEERKRRPKVSLGSFASALGVKGGSPIGGGMVLSDGQSVAEGLAQGKMLSDQIREHGQRQYENLEKQIREHGEQWLKEEAEELKKLSDAQMQEMKQGALSWLPGSSSKKE